MLARAPSGMSAEPSEVKMLGLQNKSSSSVASTSTASLSVPRQKKKEKRLFEIDYIGTGTYQVSQLNLLHQRSIEPYKNSDAILSARGLHHRSREVFVKEVQSASSLISGLMRREKVTQAKYKPSPQLMIPHFQRALAYERLKQLDKAVEDYSVCIRIDPHNSAALFNRSGLHKVSE
ncbi:hypothetical protein B484DRAFT_404567 [Ochromonadaceae sp. CCMP2298]|nr:hypothetical protein B484DRAFT_404567 [Ochromonadaceae sp. CCMP2298]